MKNAFKKVVSFVLATAAVATAVFGFTSCGKKDTFKIGCSGPLTGPAAVYGEAVSNGAKLAVKEINANGGLFGKYQIELMVYDDQHNASLVETGYLAQYEKGVQASLGCVTSAPCAEFVKLSKDDNLFFITPSASNDEIPKESNGYQMCFADGNQGKAAALFVNENYAAQTIGILYNPGDNYSKGIYDQFVANLSGVNHTDATFVNTDTDFSSQATALKDCAFVFMPIYYTPASKYMLAVQDVSGSKNEVFYGCDGFDGITGIEGFNINDIPQEVSYLSHFDANATAGKAKEFIDAFKAEYNQAPIQFAAAAYDCVYTIVAAIEKQGEDKFDIKMSASEVCTLLKASFDSADFSYTGATGTNMKWAKASNDGYGYVEKTATKYIVKEKTAN